MKADQIIKNAKIFTSDTDNLKASALVVKDGKFVYVGDESGLSDMANLSTWATSPDFLTMRERLPTSAESLSCLVSSTAMSM